MMELIGDGVRTGSMKHFRSTKSFLIMETLDSLCSTKNQVVSLPPNTHF